MKPQDVATGFAEAWNRGDAGAIAGLFTEEADFVNVVGFWWTRREQIRHNHAYGFAHIFPGSTMAIERLRVRDLGETAVVHARWHMHGQSMPASQAGETGSAEQQAGSARAPQQAGSVGSTGRAASRRGILVFVTRRQDDGRWLAVAAQNTDIVPGSQTLLAEDSGLRPTRYDDS